MVQHISQQSDALKNAKDNKARNMKLPESSRNHPNHLAIRI
jgi:hypothetical protein